MGFFSKNKNKNDGFIINTDDDSIKISGDKNLAPHAMTADEVLDLWHLGDDQPTNVVNTGALEALKKRMATNANNDTKSNEIPIAAEPKKVEENKQPVVNDDVQLPEPEPATGTEVEEQQSLVEKVKRYTIDENGNDASQNNEPLYQLESVAEIISNNGEAAIKKLSKKYDIYIDDLGKNKHTQVSQKNNTSNIEQETSQDDNVVNTTPAFKKMVDDATKRESEQIFEALFPSEIHEQPKDISVPDISDIDTHEVGISNTAPTNTATIRFTPVKDAKGNTGHITISSVTKHIDLDDDVYEDISSQSTSQTLEQTEFDRFVPQHEITDKSGGKGVLRQFAIKKRSAFLSLVFSVISVLVLLSFLIPPIFDSLIMAKPKNAIITCGVFLLLSIIANISMFADLKNLTYKRCGFDALATLASVATMSFTIISALNASGEAYYTILLCSIILLVRAQRNFKNLSYSCNNIKQILSKNSSNAVTLISDPSTAHAMVKNAIDGDVLIAAGRKTNLVKDYFKHAEFSPLLSGKCSVIFWCTLIFSIICGIMAYFYVGTQSGIIDAFYCASTICCIIAMPTLFLINSLPLASASKKLNAKGAMIAGMHGAEKIELTNAAVINVNDIFPSGTIKMYSMKVLSNNNIDDTILRAASLTAAVNSPLESIFQQIAGTNSSYAMPDSDTVKYEKNLGISGWVNNELLFIGNRSLMQAHGIKIPSLEVDKKILRQGFFPIYVANADAACALIVVQYNAKPEIAKELRKVTELGLTLLIENCDQNVTEAMVCDYFDLQEGTVKVLSNAGVHLCKSATLPANECSAPALYRGSNLNLIKIINCASKIKKSNKILTVMYSIFAIFGVMYFVYSAFSNLATVPSADTILIFEIAATLLSIIGFLIRKP